MIRVASFPLAFASADAFRISLQTYLETPEHVSAPILRAEVIVDECGETARRLTRRLIPRVYRDENTLIQHVAVSECINEFGRRRITACHSLDLESLVLRQRRLKSDPSPELLNCDLPFFYPRVSQFTVIYNEVSDTLAEIAIDAIPIRDSGGSERMACFLINLVMIIRFLR
jgi:hypothetical protein